MPNHIETSFATRASKIIDYKKVSLSLPNDPIQLIGSIDVTQISEFLKTVPMFERFPSKSVGFSTMSEYITKNDLGDPSPYNNNLSYYLDLLIEQIALEVKKSVEAVISHPTIIVRGVIDTIDHNSCIIPHSDGFVFHKYSFRVHVPLIITEKSIGTNFNPWTCEPRSWQMKTVGGIYLFNNFEPHTVMTLDEGIRSHLIFDVSVEDLLDDCKENYEEARKVLGNRGDSTTLHHSPNTITHSVSNLTIRNNLNKLYAGLPPKNDLMEQATNQAITEAREWIKNLLTFELENGKVRAI